MKECKHRFEARYLEEFTHPNELGISEIEGINPKYLRELFIINKYIGDICIKCGKFVKYSE